MERHNWIQAAVKHHGALHAHLGIPKNKKIPHLTLVAAAKRPGKVGAEARLAMTLAGFRHAK